MAAKGKSSTLRALALGGLVLGLCAPVSAGPARADADGPDYYRVTGLFPGAGLSIHVLARAGSDVVGWIPHDGVKLKNLGCKGGLSLVEWEKASPAERRTARYRRWCKITYKGKTGWVNGGYLRE